MVYQTNPDAGVGELLTAAEVAALLKVSPNWVHRHATGHGVLLPGVKVGKYWRFRRSVVDQLITHCEALASDAIARKRRGKAA